MSRLAVFHWNATGIGDGNTFGFWPMILGGFFLYISYYGCDQSQAQRLLATKDRRGARRALVINGIMRFPLVLTYCAVGVLLIPFIAENPDFASTVRNISPDYVMPFFFRDYVPPGILGVIVAGIFAASMSSLDSAINSLSASTYNDFMVRIFPHTEKRNDSAKILISRIITVFWGGFATACAIFMAEGAETVIELVNKIGSAFYGPIAGVFFLGFFSKKGWPEKRHPGPCRGCIYKHYSLAVFREAGFLDVVEPDGLLRYAGCRDSFFSVRKRKEASGFRP